MSKKQDKEITLSKLYELIYLRVFLCHKLSELPQQLQPEEINEQENVKQEMKDLYKSLYTFDQNVKEYEAGDSIKRDFLKLFNSLSKEDRLSFFNKRFVLGKIYPPTEDECSFLAKIMVTLMDDGDRNFSSVGLFLGRVYEAYLQTKDIQYFELIVKITFEKTDLYYHFVETSHDNIPIRCVMKKQLCYNKNIIKTYGGGGKSKTVYKLSKNRHKPY